MVVLALIVPYKYDCLECTPLLLLLVRYLLSRQGNDASLHISDSAWMVCVMFYMCNDNIHIAYSYVG